MVYLSYVLFRILEPMLDLDTRELVKNLFLMQEKYEINQFVQLVLTLPCEHFNTEEPERTGTLVETILDKLHVTNEIIEGPCRYV